MVWLGAGLWAEEWVGGLKNYYLVILHLGRHCCRTLQFNEHDSLFLFKAQGIQVLARTHAHAIAEGGICRLSVPTSSTRHGKRTLSAFEACSRL